MRGGPVYTFHEDGTWRNRLEGSAVAGERHVSKEQAVAVGRTLAFSLETYHLVQDVDGTIASRESFVSCVDQAEALTG